jgi:hypothetical protein
VRAALADLQAVGADPGWRVAAPVAGRVRADSLAAPAGWQVVVRADLGRPAARPGPESRPADRARRRCPRRDWSGPLAGGFAAAPRLVDVVRHRRVGGRCQHPHLERAASEVVSPRSRPGAAVVFAVWSPMSRRCRPWHVTRNTGGTATPVACTGAGAAGVPLGVRSKSVVDGASAVSAPSGSVLAPLVDLLVTDGSSPIESEPPSVSDRSVPHVNGDVKGAVENAGAGGSEAADPQTGNCDDSENDPTARTRTRSGGNRLIGRAHRCHGIVLAGQLLRASR